MADGARLVVVELDLLEDLLSNIVRRELRAGAGLDRLLTFAEVAERVGQSARTVRRLVDRRELRSVKAPSGHGLRVRESDLAAYIDRRGVQS